MITKRTSKAYDNLDFLHSKDGRVIRLLAEYLHPKQKFEKENIKRTIVVFGSARVKSAGEMNKKLSDLNADLGNQSLPDKSSIFNDINRQNDIKKLSTKYYEECRRMTYKLAEWSNSLPASQRFTVCTGGGPGLMEAANLGASEAGAPTVGLNISLPFEQEPNPAISDRLNFEFHYFFMRKFWFVYLAAAAIAFPGGFGTMDELMEILTLRQTKKITKPLMIYLYSEEFWKSLINFDVLIDYGMISPEDMSLFKFLNSPEEAFTIIKDDLTRIYKLKN